MNPFAARPQRAREPCGKSVLRRSFAAFRFKEEMIGVPREASEHEDDSNVTQTDGRVRASQGCGEHDGAIRLKIVRWRAIDVDEAHETAEAADDHRRPRSITP